MNVYMPSMMILLMGLLYHWLPLWRRENQYFGVTTPAGFAETGEGRGALRRFRAWMWLGSTLALLLVWAVAGSERGGPVILATLLQLAAAIAVFAAAHRRVAGYAMRPPARTASLEPDREAIPGGIFAVVLPLAILAGTALYMGANRELLPERIPVHWNLAGEPDRWKEASAGALYGPLAAGATMCLLLLGAAMGILKASPRPAGDSAEWTRRFRRANLRLLAVLTTVMAVQFSLLAAKPVMAAQGVSLPDRLVGLMPVAAMVLMVIPIVRMSRQSGSGADATPDRRWYLGQFYYNPEDPALMVERRFGLGYTLNFGNRLAWLFLRSRWRWSCRRGGWGSGRLAIAPRRRREWLTI